MHRTSNKLPIALLVVGLSLLFHHRLSLFLPGVTQANSVKTGATTLGLDAPCRVPIKRLSLLPVSPAEMQTIYGFIQPPRDKGVVSPSFLLHVLRAHGLNSELDSAYVRSGEHVVQALTEGAEGERIFGRAAIVPTPFGWRFPTQPSQPIFSDRSLEHHRDQNIASLGELGISLNHPVSNGGVNGTLRDVLKDSVANFHLNQKELPWSVLAYALYLPPQKDWTNRFGERFDFDRVIQAMIDCRLDEQSCGGTHLLYSMTIVGRVDAQRPILTDEMRKKLWAHIDRAVKVAINRQQPDGSWHPGWNYELLPKDEPRGRSYLDDKQNRLIMTGHLAEWMLYLPDELAVPDSVLLNASRWLKSEIMSSDLALREKLFCPMTHGVTFLRHVIFVSEETSTSAAATIDRTGRGAS